MNAVIKNITGQSARDNVLRLATSYYNPAIVAIDEAAIAALELPKGALTPMRAGLIGTPMGSTLANAIVYLVLLNSINYRFWHARLTGLVRYEYEGAVGAMGMRKAFTKVWGDHAGPQGLKGALADDPFNRMFGEIPDAESRWLIFSELLAHGGSELERFATTLAQKIEATGELTTEDAARLAVFFPKVYSDPLLKKAQLTICEIAGHCHELGIPMKEKLTVFADYQVPRIMRALGVLTYSPELAKKIENLELLPKDGADERAIRGATVLAGELMATRFGVDASMVDNYLWTNRNTVGSVPFHLTLTEDY